MIEIQYAGGTTCEVITKQARLVIRPDGNIKKVTDTTILLSLSPEERPAGSFGEKLHVYFPGEFEVADISLTGVSVDTVREGVVYRAVVGDIAIGIVGDGMMELDDSQLEALGVLDVLVLPLSAEGLSSAVALARKIEPKVIIPLHKNSPIANIESYAKEAGAVTETVASFKLKNHASLPLVRTLYVLGQK